MSTDYDRTRARTSRYIACSGAVGAKSGRTVLMEHAELVSFAAGWRAGVRCDTGRHRLADQGRRVRLRLLPELWPSVNRAAWLLHAMAARPSGAGGRSFDRADRDALAVPQRRLSSPDVLRLPCGACVRLRAAHGPAHASCAPACARRRRAPVERLTHQLGFPQSRDTLLRTLAQADRHEAAGPRVLGIDD
jgi:hypothetical protein